MTVLRRRLVQLVKSAGRGGVIDHCRDGYRLRNLVEFRWTVIYLTLAVLLHVAERTLCHDYAVRDYGLLEAAVLRTATCSARQ